MKASVRKHDIYIFDGGGVSKYLTELTGKVDCMIVTLYTFQDAIVSSCQLNITFTRLPQIKTRRLLGKIESARIPFFGPSQG